MDNGDLEERTTATGLWMYADTYRRAAKHLAETADLRFSAPIYFLYSHAIELVLKAYLRAHGATLLDLKSAGHRLPALLRRACWRGLDLGASAEKASALIAMLDLYNQDHEFRYIVIGYKTLPALKEVEEVTLSLLGATRAHCGVPPTAA
jgi:hypothetical protein